MDMSGISAALSSLQSSLSMTVLQRSMGQTADVVGAILETVPDLQQLAPKAGSMDILV